MTVLKPHQANLLNAAVLVTMGLWGFFQRGETSSIALIPVGFGVLFALSTLPLRQENRLVLLILILLTSLLLVALFLLLLRADGWDVFRLLLMMGASAYALLVFVKKQWTLGKKEEPTG